LDHHANIAAKFFGEILSARPHWCEDLDGTPAVAAAPPNSNIQPIVHIAFEREAARCREGRRPSPLPLGHARCLTMTKAKIMLFLRDFDAEIEASRTVPRRCRAATRCGA
jgi:hypothetical protein